MSVMRYALPDGDIRYQVKFLFRGEEYRKKGFRRRSEALAWEIDTRRALENPAPALILAASLAISAKRFLE